MNLPSASQRRFRRCVLAALLAASSIGWLAEGSSLAAAPAELISVSPTGGGPLSSQDVAPSVSGDGNIVVFSSFPPVGTEFGVDQVFVRNRAAGTTTALPAPFSVTDMRGGVVSRDGCHVAFWGFFTGVIFIFSIPPQWDIYTWDRCTPGAQPVLVSIGANFPLLTNPSDELRELAISADGRYIAYATYTAGDFVRIARIDTSTRTEDRLQTGIGLPYTIDISDDGAFLAIGTDVQFGDPPLRQVFGWSPPCVAGLKVQCNTELLSVNSAGGFASGESSSPSVSADGRYVAFVSSARDIVGFADETPSQIYVRDRVARTTKLVTSTPLLPMDGRLEEPEISPDGSQITMQFRASDFAPVAADINQVYVARSSSGYFDSAVFDLVSFGVSDAPTSQDSFSPSMSSNGRFVAFASFAGAELSGNGKFPPGLDVWMRQRPIALDITPSLDFGTIDPGSTSGPQNAVVTNTSGVPISIGAVTPPVAPFSITANGCGGVLPPGASCAITIVFSPTAPGGASSSVTVTGDGLSVSASLVGVGRTPPVPTAGSLTMTPTVADYGSAVVGSALGTRSFTVSNPGETAVPIAGVGLSGAGADQFTIATNTCVGSVAGGASCTVTVSATVTREGAMTATLGILGTGGQSAQATLRLRGLPPPFVPPVVEVFTPLVTMNPGVVRPGPVTVAVGEGFPPNIDVDLILPGDITPLTVRTDPAGAFRSEGILILRNGVRIGGTEVVAVDQAQFSGVRAPLLIDAATYRPSASISPAITNGVRSLVGRSG